MKPAPISRPSVAPALHAARGALKTCRGKSAAKTSAASGRRRARYESGGQWSRMPRATENVEPQMSVVSSIAPSAARPVFSLISFEAARLRSHSQEDFEDAGRGGAPHRADAFGERELFREERIDIDGAAAQ